MKYQKLPDNYKEMRLSPYKKDYSYSYVFGLFPVIELIDNMPSAVFRVIISSRLAESGREVIESRAKSAGIYTVCDDKTIDRLSPKDNCFAIGVFRKFEAKTDPAKSHIVLVDPSDKGNLGNIVRTAVAFGFEDLVIVGSGADLFDPHTVRSSMGAVFHIRPEHFDTFEEYAAGAGSRIYYPFMLKGAPMEEEKPETALPCSLIFGNESSGLDDSYLKLGRSLRITHGPGVDSLNLTVAAGIGMHWFAQGTGFARTFPK